MTWKQTAGHAMTYSYAAWLGGWLAGWHGALHQLASACLLACIQLLLASMHDWHLSPATSHVMCCCQPAFWCSCLMPHAVAASMVTLHAGNPNIYKSTLSILCKEHPLAILGLSCFCSTCTVHVLQTSHASYKRR
jgi:hypothetical protein